MKSKVAGALLSGLVFPGVGQYYLGRRSRGLLFLAPAAIAGLLYFNGAWDQANSIVDQMLSGKMAADPAAVAAGFEGQATPLAMTVSGAVFLICWVGSVLEALLTKPAQ
jgi:TM2 domain-containing membrane protein YozV